MPDSQPLLTYRELTQLSKLLSFILRHGATKENIEMTPDGYVKVDDLVNYQLLNLCMPYSLEYKLVGSSQIQKSDH